MTETAITAQETQEQMLSTVPAVSVDVWQDTKAFDQMARKAAMLAKSTIIPQSFQGKPEDCFLALDMAARMQTNPLVIMQSLSVVRGRPTWSGQACITFINNCGKFRNMKFVYTGTRGTDKRGCYVTATRVADGEAVDGTEVTMQMVKDEGWITNSKWKTMPEQMLGYRAASFFARMYCPEALMGLQTYDEVVDASQEKTTAQRLADALRAETEGNK